MTKLLLFIRFPKIENAFLMTFCFVAALAVSLIFGRFFIPFMRKKKLGQQILSEVTWHHSKAGTPTMGGFLFIVASFICAVGASAALYFATGDSHFWLPLLLWGFSASFGVIGFLDDYVKVAKHRNLGLTVVQKLILQIAVSLAFVSLLRAAGLVTPDVVIPFTDIIIHFDWVVYLVLAVLAISGMVNAVNFADGVDGLLGSVTLPICVFYAAAAFLTHNLGVGPFAASLAGGIIGFLVFNFNPAKVFAGDTGSMFLGGAVCAMAFASNRPLILAVVGLVYLVEIASVIIQVSYFKATKGKRIFRMAPIHHHFEMGGWSEKKLCAVFGGFTFLLCAATLWFTYM